MFGFGAQKASREQVLLRILGSGYTKGVSARELASRTSLTETEVTMALNRLQAMGENALVRGRVRRGTKAVRWRITGAGREALDKHR